MDRLTHERCNGIKTGYWSAAKKEELVQRLAEFENLGLEPEYIGDLQEYCKYLVNQLDLYRRSWHDAKTDPPKEAGEYIVMIKGGADVITLLYDGGLWFEEDEEGWQTYYSVTHWMPLPEPPEEVNYDL